LDTRDWRLEINPAQVTTLGQRLVGLDWKSTGFATFESALPSSQPAQLADFFFFNSALLFDFYGLETEIDGQYIKGSDLFFAFARRKARDDPGFFTAARLVDLAVAEYEAVYALDENPAHTLINRAEERVAILQDLARGLLRNYQASTLVLLDQCDHHLHTAGDIGLLDRLPAFVGYNDPHFKKAFVFIKALVGLNLWDAQDREDLFIPVDYHLIRMALRTGLVRVTDPELADQLHTRTLATPADDWEIREIIKRAYKALEENAGVDVFVLDEIFWTIGRSCCHYARPPRCTACDFTDCSVMKSFEYRCPGRCPLSGACLGSSDEFHRTFFEPRLVTTYY
jgi:hypothetical protein